MSYQLFTPPSRATDATGSPYSGAKWYFYQSNSLTLQSVFANASLATTLSNPVVADSGGKFVPIYFDSTKSYRGICKNADESVTLHDIDPISSDGSISTDLAASDGATKIGTVYGKALSGVLSGFNSRFIEPVFPVTNLKAFGDSFSAQPNAHTSSGDSMVKKYATLIGVASPSISATSGYSSADGQTSIFANSISVSDHIIHAYGQNDAQFLGTASDKSLREGDVARIWLANLLWLGKAAGTNKIAAGSTSSGQLAVAGSWSADSDLSGAYKSATTNDAMLATFTNCRYAVVLYKAKIGSVGQFNVKLEDDDTNKPVFNAAPESAWVPTNTGQTWAVMARTFDFGSTLPTGKMQINVTSGSGDVSIVGFLGFADTVLSGPLIGVADVSRRGSLGYATASGSEVNVPIINRVGARAMAVASALGLNIIDLPVASIVDSSTGLDTDAFHPNETGAGAIAAAWYARVTSGTPLFGNRPDLLIQGLIQNTAGEMTPGMVMVWDRMGRYRLGRLGGNSIYFPSDDNYVRMTTSGIYFTPVAANGSVDITKALLLTGDNSHCYLSARVGDLVLGNASGNKMRIRDNAFEPENNSSYAIGSSSKVMSAVWTSLEVIPPQVVSSLPTPGASIKGCRATVSDSSVAMATNFGAIVAGSGTNIVPVFCDGTNWRIG